MDEIREILSRLEERADPGHAQIHKKYHKSSLRFYGLRTPEMRKIAKDILPHYKDISEKTRFFKLCDRLWQEPFFETRMITAYLLSARLKFFEPKDFNCFYPMFKDCDGWAITDTLAIKVLGEFLLRFPRFHRETDKWRFDDHLWVRRAGILRFIALSRGKHEWSDNMEFILKFHLSESDFFIRKAIGWTLREWSKNHPRKVIEFVKQNENAISALSKKEALRKIPQ